MTDQHAGEICPHTSAETPPPRHRSRLRPVVSQTPPVAGDDRYARRVSVLMSLIQEHLAHGVDRGGHRWAALSQPALLAALNERLAAGDRAKIRTLQNLVKEPGIVRKRALVDEKVVCLLRLGEPEPVTPEQEARERDVKRMAGAWSRKVGQAPTRKEYGLIRGLAEVWNIEGCPAPALFSFVLRRWDAFMAAARCDPEWRDGRYYRLPALSVVRRFPGAAVEMYETLVLEPARTREYEQASAESSSPRESF